MSEACRGLLLFVIRDSFEELLNSFKFDQRVACLACLACQS